MVGGGVLAALVFTISVISVPLGNVLLATSFYVVQRTCHTRLAGRWSPWFVVAEREDHRRGVKRAHASEADPRQVEIELRKGELPGDEIAGHEPGDAPDQSGDCRDLDRAIHIRAIDLESALVMKGDLQHQHGRGRSGDQEQKAVEGHSRIVRQQKHQ
jgi:hypothetical protein